ncbi:MAG: GMC family oxidoreductase [Longimicrobiales bacterium]|nr:GMC family oxidoreductase [Longimicrobiales bacterium]
MSTDRLRFDVVVVGSGFGGALAAWPLVRAGHSVLMLERGRPVERGPWNWEGAGTVMRSDAYLDGPELRARTDRGDRSIRGYACVGGPSVYYGGVSLRFREEDFDADAEIVADSGAAWPFTYRELMPYYAEAERILGVAGRRGEDPTEPAAEADYPFRLPTGLSPVSRTLQAAARELGLHPFRLPLAIHYGDGGDGHGTDGRDRHRGSRGERGSGRAGHRGACISCATCDTFACAIEAKNDLATRVLPPMVERGLELRSGLAATAVLLEDGRAAGVEWVDRESGARDTVAARAVVLAGGALATPQLLLASGLADRSPAGDVVGRYLTRHCSAIAFGLHPWLPHLEGRFHKDLGINDFYRGHPRSGIVGPLGHLQQTQTPHRGTVEGEIPAILAAMAAPVVRRLTGLLAMSEDRPRYRNRVWLDPAVRDRHGMPRLRIEHSYHDRDVEARAFLVREAQAVHRAAGAAVGYTHPIDTFSHALGTVRMGADASTAPLDALGRFRGVPGLRISDGSALPRSAGVNPSLTIAANALRIGYALEESLRRERRSRVGTDVPDTKGVGYEGVP